MKCKEYYSTRCSAWYRFTTIRVSENTAKTTISGLKSYHKNYRLLLKKLTQNEEQCADENVRTEEEVTERSKKGIQLQNVTLHQYQ
jgi:hypothetical protein